MFTPLLTRNKVFTIIISRNILFTRKVFNMIDSEIFAFCHKLRFYKIKYDLTQKEMARMCKIGVASMSKLLRNEIPPRLSVECVFNLAKALDIEVKDLFTVDIP